MTHVTSQPRSWEQPRYESQIGPGAPEPKDLPTPLMGSLQGQPTTRRTSLLLSANKSLPMGKRGRLSNTCAKFIGSHCSVSSRNRYLAAVFRTAMPPH